MSTATQKRIAIYPGSFDPLTNGHVDIIERGARIFDSIIVAILANVEKTPLFSESERVAIIRDVFKDKPNVQVETFDGLLVDYAQRKKANVLVRGLRAVSDFEYEFQMALMNRHLAPGLETVFMMPAEQYTYISSRLIKEVFTLGGEITGLVPPIVEEQLRAKQAAEGRQAEGEMNFASRMSRVTVSPTLRFPPKPIACAAAASTSSTSAPASRISRRRSTSRRPRMPRSMPTSRSTRRRRASSSCATRSRSATASTTASTSSPKKSSSPPAPSRRSTTRRWSLYEQGDEVITHGPFWPSIVDQIKLADATPVVVQTHMEDGFAIKAASFIEAMTPRTKAIVINSPCNPTGALMSEAEMALLADAAAARGIWIVLDFTYEKLIYEPVPHNLVKILFDRMRDKTVVCNAASKAYAMTGWRCGWAIGPKDMIAQCNVVQGHSTSNINSITQKAAIAALTGPQDSVTMMLNEYRKRRDAVHGWLTADPRFVCVKPGGAFYLFPYVADLLSPTGIRSSGEFAEALLKEVSVAVTPVRASTRPGTSACRTRRRSSG